MVLQLNYSQGKYTMVKRTIKLEQLSIPNPCANNWEQMVGNDQIRFCTQCNGQVFDLSKMTRKQAEALVTEKQGNLCAKITRHSDGTIQTIDNITNKVSYIQPIAKAASATIFTLMSFSALANAQTSPKTNIPIIVSVPQAQKQDKEPIDRSAQIYGSIYDSSRAVITGADIILTNETTGDTYKTTSNEEGKYSIKSLAPGLYTMEIVTSGFENFQQKSIVLTPNNSLLVEANLIMDLTTEKVKEQESNEVLICTTTGGQLSSIRESPRKRILNGLMLPYKKFKKLFFME